MKIRASSCYLTLCFIIALTLTYAQRTYKMGENTYIIYGKTHTEFKTHSNLQIGQTCKQYALVKKDTLYVCDEFSIATKKIEYINTYAIPLKITDLIISDALKDSLTNTYKITISTANYSVRLNYTMYNLIGPTSLGFVFTLPLYFTNKETAVQFKINLKTKNQ